MLTRVLSASVFLLIMLPCICFSATPLFVALMVFLSVRAVYEMLRCTGLHKNAALSVPMYLVSGLPILARYCDNDLLFPAIFVCSLIVLTVYVFQKDKPDFGKVAVSWFVSLYAIMGFVALVLLTNVVNGSWYLVLLAFLAVWVTDSCGLIFGKMFGKHKLIPAVSPKKTVEGAIGGVVSCIAVFLLYAAILEHFFNYEFKSYLLIALCGFVCSMIAIIGDLIFSAVKRAFGIKDFGRLMPGHGGVLDRFDSVISVAPILLLLVLTMSIG